VILAIDPTEHAAAVDPLKAYVAHENDLGNWIKVDREGNIIEAGEAVKNLDGNEPAMEKGLQSPEAAPMVAIRAKSTERLPRTE